LAGSVPTDNPADWVLVQVYEGSYQQLQDKSQAITVHSVLLADARYHQSAHTVTGNSKRKQSQAALLSLDLLRRVLQFGRYSNPALETGEVRLRRYGLQLLAKTNAG
jgi:hypothetical protein